MEMLLQMLADKEVTPAAAKTPKEFFEVVTSQLQSLESLHAGPPTWTRTVKFGAAVYETGRMATTKTRRMIRKAHVNPKHNINTKPLLTCPRFQRTFRTRSGPLGHLKSHCNNSSRCLHNRSHRHPCKNTTVCTTTSSLITGDHNPDVSSSSVAATSIIPATTPR
nr:unnamed protein product [Spirometra erinaceieuropaei]